MGKSGIGLAVFEIKGKQRKKLFEYNTTPDKYEQGIATMNTKFGMSLKAQSEKIARRMRY